tara:strand:+ start:45 stop:656 length:612 start_codon:yes stop_codon:yes gene_type:complete
MSNRCKVEISSTTGPVEWITDYWNDACPLKMYWDLSVTFTCKTGPIPCTAPAVCPDSTITEKLRAGVCASNFLFPKDKGKAKEVADCIWKHGAGSDKCQGLIDELLKLMMKTMNSMGPKTSAFNPLWFQFLMGTLGPGWDYKWVSIDNDNEEKLKKAYESLHCYCRDLSDLSYLEVNPDANLNFTLTKFMDAELSRISKRVGV